MYIRILSLLLDELLNLLCFYFVLFCLLFCSKRLADPPYFSVRPRPLYQRHPGQSVTMPCVAVGDPKPTIVWRKVMLLSVIIVYFAD